MTNCQHTRTSENHTRKFSIMVNNVTGERLNLCSAHVPYYTLNAWTSARERYPAYSARGELVYVSIPKGED